MIPTPHQVATFAKATARRLLTGAQDATDAQHEQRLAVCNSACPFRGGGIERDQWQCIHPECGCWLEKKALWASEQCPVGQWGQIPTVPADFGIVIGSYGLPNLIEMQIRLLKDKCGEFPILISDDCTPGTETRFDEMAAKYPNVEALRAGERIGHYGGDLRVFYDGMVWAMARGLRWLVKLSQRFCVTKEGWIQDGVKELKESGKAILTRLCWDNGGGSRPRTQLWVRTECCILDVRQWAKPDVFQQLSPRTLGNPTELAINHIVVHHLGNSRADWSLYGDDRYKDEATNIVWHAIHGPPKYRELFERYAVKMDEGFTSNGWQHAGNWRRG